VKSRAQMLLVHATKCVGTSLDQIPIILPCGFIDALSGGTSCAESCHERAVLTAQDHDVWIRPVKIVVERENLELFRP